MNWFRMTLKTPVLLKLQVPPREQVPAQLTGLVSTSASGWLACYTSATLHATAATLDLHSL